MAFVGGLIWAYVTAGMRLKSDVTPLPSAFLFCLGATVTSLLSAPFLEPFPTIAEGDLSAIEITVRFTEGMWWVLSIAARAG